MEVGSSPAKDFQPSLIAAVDIGSPMSGRLGWAVLESGETGKDISRLISVLVEGLARGPVALGFEAPLWVPIRTDPMALTKARGGEGARSWSAGAGTGALATGLVVTTHILQALRDAAPDATASLDFRNPPAHPGGLLLWEAFVSAAAKGSSHQDDALIAAKAFRASCDDLSKCQKLVTEPNLNLLGAMLLRAGWSTELRLLEAEMLVVSG
jgi:hypothetical protein